MDEPLSPPGAQTSTKSWSPRTKLLVSALVVFHLVAVFVAPMWFASRQQSPLVAPFASVLRPYINTLFLNHGYAFFAPEVGPNHLIRYRLEFANGRAPEQGVFPNLNEEWPRLAYHRHFMLSETLFTYSNVPPLPPNASEQDRAAFAERQQPYERLKASVAKHLVSVNHAEKAELHRLEHQLIFPDQVTRDRKRLDAEDTYIDLDAPPGPPPQREVLPGSMP